MAPAFEKGAAALLAAILLFAKAPEALSQEGQPAANAPDAPAASLPRAIDGARSAAVEAASDGRYRREAVWAQETEAGQVVEVPLQLYAGNEYVFSLGYHGAGGAPELSLRDGAGRLIPAAVKRDEGVILLTVSVEATGVYRIKLVSGEAKVALALTYVYR